MIEDAFGSLVALAFMMARPARFEHATYGLEELFSELPQFLSNLESPFIIGFFRFQVFSDFLPF